ncbi:unnamed protein product [Heterobilharzia americana]|nr:unnamed protein product [Heterobilharzia americana]
MLSINLTKAIKDRLLPSLEVCNGNAKMIRCWASIVAPYLIDLYTTYCSFHEKSNQLYTYLENISLKKASLLQGGDGLSEISERNSYSTGLLKIHLNTPVQRIQCYHLLVGRLKKEANISDIKAMDDAQKILRGMCETLNVTINLWGLTIRPSKLGKFLLEGDFTVTHTNQSIKCKKQSHVILFSRRLLFTKCSTSVKKCLTNVKSYQQYQFPCLEDFMRFFEFSHNINLMSNKIVYEVEGELCLRHIGLSSNSDNNDTDNRYFSLFTENYTSIHHFKSVNTSIKQIWVDTIKHLLMNQLHQLRNKRKLYLQMMLTKQEAILSNYQIINPGINSSFKSFEISQQQQKQQQQQMKRRNEIKNKK